MSKEPKAAGTPGSTSTKAVDATRFYSRAKIRFFSISQGTNVSFKAFVKSFSDKYECNWTETRAFGRMDPLTTYQGTGRKISIEWDIPSYSLGEARRNLKNCSKLIQAMYPKYSSTDGAATLQTPPYFKVKFMNMITNSRSSGGGQAATNGLFCTIGGFEFNPDFEAGVYVKGGNIYPKVINASVEMTILHDHLCGAGASGGYNFSSFPYGKSKAPMTPEEAQELASATMQTMATLGGAGVAADAVAYSAGTGGEIDPATAKMMAEAEKESESLGAIAAKGATMGQTEAPFYQNALDAIPQTNNDSVAKQEQTASAVESVFGAGGGGGAAKYLD